MRQIWEYDTYDAGRVRGEMVGFSDRGGTDVTYSFRRLDSDGNSTGRLDMVSGSRLKTARNVTQETVHVL